MEDSIELAIVLAAVLPFVFGVVAVRLWPRFKGPWLAKLIICLALFALIVPGTCFSLVALDEELFGKPLRHYVPSPGPS